MSAVKNLQEEMSYRSCTFY